MNPSRLGGTWKAVASCEIEVNKMRFIMVRSKEMGDGRRKEKRETLAWGPSHHSLDPI